MSSFLIKNIAIITMLIDHTIKAFNINNPFLYLLGRIAFPLFAFQITIGYENTKNLKKYIGRILIFAIISQIPFIIFHQEFFPNQAIPLNILFTLIIGIICMYVYDARIIDEIKKDEKILIYVLKIAIISTLVVLASVINVDYSSYGVILILFIHIYYKKNKLFFINGYIVITLLKYTITYFYTVPIDYYISMLIGGIIPLAIILSYNGKKGKSIKYWFYILYPLHLTVLIIIKLFIK